MADFKCPQCGAPLPEGTAKCKYCGADVFVAPPQYQQAPPQYQQAPPQYQQAPPQYQQAPPQYQQAPPQYQAPFAAGDPAINPYWPVKSKVAAGLLGILLGGIGVHKFYLGKAGMGILYLLFCWTGIPAIIGLVEGIIYLCQSDREFQVKNQVRVQ